VKFTRKLLTVIKGMEDLLGGFERLLQKEYSSIFYYKGPIFKSLTLSGLSGIQLLAV